MIRLTKRILFTGGGSAGHVSVNLALIPRFVQMGWEVAYMGSKQGIEVELVRKLDSIEYIGISTGKLRRYFDMENVKDPARILKGVIQAYRQIKRMKPDIVFSKGGFVSVPVILGAWLNRVPIIIHESDLTPGLANKISMPFASKICITFPETKEHIKGDKAVFAGAIVREELMKGQAIRGRSLCDFVKSKPIIVCMGGSLGSQRINDMLRRNLHQLIPNFQIVHLCGKGQVDLSYQYREYKQFEYVHEELADLLSMADMVISRAGSNAIFEFLALKIPMLLIPLTKQASRGDQILNAQSFKSSGYCEVLFEEDMNDQTFMEAINTVFAKRNQIVAAMNTSGNKESLDRVIDLIIKTSMKES